MLDAKSQLTKKSYEDLLPGFKNCMDDDWNPDLRFSAMKMMSLVVEYLQEHLSDFQISKLYPMILERLDDAQDPIRIQTCEVIKSLFLCKNVKSASAYF